MLYRVEDIIMTIASEPRPIELSTTAVHRAYDVIRSRVHRTPLLCSRSLSQIASSLPGDDDIGGEPKFNLFFKCENFQRMGSFKTRGALHNLINLIDDVGIEEMRAKGVTTHSSGNHAQSLAMAAAEFGIPAHIVMPAVAPKSKIAGARAYTPDIHESGTTSVDRTRTMERIIQKTGAVYIPSSDHPHTILGQGTVALEMDQQYRRDHQSEVRGLSLVMTPCGGGGLLSGTAVYFSEQPSVRVIGAEPSFQGANDGEFGLKSTPPTRITHVDTMTIADGLRVPVGVHPWNVLLDGSSSKAKYVEGIYSVTEDEIKMAMKIILERLKILVEPSSATPLAVLLFNREFRRWARAQQQADNVGCWDVGIILSGGNTTVEDIAKYFA